MIKKCKKCKKGFTLVELLVVIAIIGILAAVGVTALSGARTKARDAKRVADTKQIQSALEMYYTDQQVYPIGSALALGGLTDCNSGADVCDTISETNGISHTSSGLTYMGLIPGDPSAQNAECAVGSTSPCHYSYTALPSGCDNSTNNCTSYTLYAYLEGSSGPLSGLICANDKGIASSTCP